MACNFRRPYCPNCSAAVTFWRCWASPFQWQHWPCDKCHATLRWNWRRRLLIGAAVAAYVPLVASIDLLWQVSQFEDIPRYIILLLLLPVLFFCLFERVELAPFSEAGQRDVKHETR